jgi:hypothetical protein
MKVSHLVRPTGSKVYYLTRVYLTKIIRSTYVGRLWLELPGNPDKI